MTSEEREPHRGADMSVFEALLRATPPMQDDGDPVAIAAALRRPHVEWAIAWGDGRLTPVSHQDAARYAAARNPAWRVVCRLVGGWGAL